MADLKDDFYQLDIIRHNWGSTTPIPKFKNLNITIEYIKKAEGEEVEIKWWAILGKK